MYKSGYLWLEQFTTVLWKHDTRTVTFSLVVVNFRVNHIGRKHVGHIISDIKDLNKFNTNWEGRIYIGMNPEWDHVNGTINLLMTGYIEYILNKFQHEAQKKPKHDPHPYVTPQYGART